MHRWRSGRGISYGYLLPNGNLLFRNREGYLGMPGSDGVQELSWDGELVWEYQNPLMRRHNRPVSRQTPVALNVVAQLYPKAWVEEKRVVLCGPLLFGAPGVKEEVGAGQIAVAYFQG